MTDQTETELDEFEKLFNETHLMVRAYIIKIGVPISAVDDLIQDIYIQYFNNQEKMPDGIEPIRWLKGIGRNISFNYFRKQKKSVSRHMETVSQILMENEISGVKHNEEEELKIALKSCLSNVSERNLQLIKLRYVNRYTSFQIAEKLEAKAEAIRVALMRCRDSLRQCIKRKVREGKNG